MATFSARVSLVDAGMLRLLFPIYACSLFSFIFFNSVTVNGRSRIAIDTNKIRFYMIFYLIIRTELKRK